MLFPGHLACLAVLILAGVVSAQDLVTGDQLGRRTLLQKGQNQTEDYISQVEVKAGIPISLQVYSDTT